MQETVHETRPRSSQSNQQTGLSEASSRTSVGSESNAGVNNSTVTVTQDQQNYIQNFSQHPDINERGKVYR